MSRKTMKKVLSTLPAVLVAFGLVSTTTTKEASAQEIQVTGPLKGAPAVRKLRLYREGRVEFALAGGRLNTDFIDNSGGVNTSDVEVNIKILTNALTEAGKLRRADRDRLPRIIDTHRGMSISKQPLAYLREPALLPFGHERRERRLCGGNDLGRRRLHAHVRCDSRTIRHRCRKPR